MLIGIHRQLTNKNGQFILTHQPQLLLEHEEDVDVESTIDRLIQFKQQFDRDEQYFVRHRLISSENCLISLDFKIHSNNDFLLRFTHSNR